MSPRARNTVDRVAGRLAATGAALGVLAGLIDVAAGSSIRGWVGNKLDTTPLGLGTIALSGVALAAAIAWQRPGGRGGGRRLVTVLTLALPAGICFTTIGRLWYLPGILLLAAAILVLATSTTQELARAVNERRWLRGLIVILGSYYVFLGADSHGLAAALGILGGLAIWAALAVAGSSHRLALSLLVLGVLPFAVATWWSVVTPLIALLVILIGLPAVRSYHRSTLRDYRPRASRRGIDRTPAVR